jgi:protocatechuate 3,4-dioxygenase beta subunit
MSGGDGSASSAALPFEVVDRAVDLERSLIVSGFMLSGRVVDPSGRGVDNVSVVAVRRDSDGRFSATTNAEGRYFLEELVPGRYT